MNFTQAISSVFRQNYANFSGRASRAEFWWWYLFLVIIYAIMVGLFIISGGYDWMATVFMASMEGSMEIPPAPGFVKFLAVIWIVFVLAVLIPNLAVITRRFHDRGMSGWWVVGLIIGTFIPYVNFVAGIAILIICALPGDEADNAYGPKPIA